MSELVYPRERTLGMVTLVIGLLAWLALIGGTFGAALVVLAVGYVLYLFVHSALIAHVKGNGVELSEAQFPDIWAQFTACCERLQISDRPTVYVLNGNGGLNAFATKFLGSQYVVLLADVVDAMKEHPDGVRFYVGHELGHLRMKHLQGQLLRWPALWLPLLGAAYSRARESTCDRHGLACSSSPEAAARAMAALSAGTQRWQSLDLSLYLKQVHHSAGFWMSLHELNAGYPWLTKRVARVIDPEVPLPRRSRLAWFISAFIPYTGPGGAVVGVLMMFYAFLIVGAVAVPAFRDQMGKATVAATVVQAQPELAKLSAYYAAHEEPPATLEAAALPAQLAGAALALNPENMVLSATTSAGTIRFVPTVDDDGQVHWTCQSGEGLKDTQLPESCRQ